MVLGGRHGGVAPADQGQLESKGSGEVGGSRPVGAGDRPAGKPPAIPVASVLHVPHAPCSHVRTKHGVAPSLTPLQVNQTKCLDVLRQRRGCGTPGTSPWPREPKKGEECFGLGQCVRQQASLGQGAGSGLGTRHPWEVSPHEGVL